jgi:hypothetical protein
MNNTTQIQINQRTETEMEPACLIVVGSEGAKLSTKSFDHALLKALDATFSSLECKEKIYSQLERKHGISRQDIPKNIKAFTNALEEMFGEASLILEIKIIHYLRNNVKDFKYHPNKEEVSFISHLENLKTFIS